MGFQPTFDAQNSGSGWTVQPEYLSPLAWSLPLPSGERGATAYGWTARRRALERAQEALRRPQTPSDALRARRTSSGSLKGLRTHLRASCLRIMRSCYARVDARLEEWPPARGSGTRKSPEKQSAGLLAHPYAVTRPSQRGRRPGTGVRHSGGASPPGARAQTDGQKERGSGAAAPGGGSGAEPSEGGLFSFASASFSAVSVPSDGHRYHRCFWVVFVLLWAKIFASKFFGKKD